MSKVKKYTKPVELTEAEAEMRETEAAYNDALKQVEASEKMFQKAKRTLELAEAACCAALEKHIRAVKRVSEFPGFPNMIYLGNPGQVSFTGNVGILKQCPPRPGAAKDIPGGGHVIKFSND